MKHKVYVALITHIILMIIIMAGVTRHAHAVISGDGRPGILVTPTRIVLEGRQRSTEVSIANNGSETGFYTISMNNKRMLENGTLENVEVAQQNEHFADPYIRISPRRITLEPGQSQTIRLLVRKTPDMQEAEYRSHLSISASPQEEEEKKAQQRQQAVEENEISIQIKANFGVTIPVILRHGRLQAEADIEYASIAFHQEDQRHHVSLLMSRSGQRSLYGDLRITHIAKDGTQTIVKNMLGVAVYTPNTKRSFDIALDKIEGRSLSSGKLIIEYLHKKKDGGQVIAKKEIVL